MHIHMNMFNLSVFNPLGCGAMQGLASIQCDERMLGVLVSDWLRMASLSSKPSFFLSQPKANLSSARLQPTGLHNCNQCNTHDKLRPAHSR